MYSEPAQILKNGEMRLFNNAELHESIKEACYSTSTPEGAAHDIATAVCNHVAAWLEDKTHVTSNDIRRIAAKHLTQHHPTAGFLYEHHHTIL